jgi:hypothetical protein
VQSFESFAWNAARNGALNEPLRYAAQRFGELLDPNAHFAAAASFTLDPVTACGEFLDLARAHASSRGKNPSYGVMLDGVERTRAALVQDPNLGAWYGSQLRLAAAALDYAVDSKAAAKAKIGKQRWLDTQSSSAARGPLRDLWTALRDSGPTGYRARLARRVTSTCADPTLTTAGWLRFDQELRLMAAVAVAEGRTDRRTALLIGRAISRAPTNDAACARLLRVLEAPSEDFIAVFALVGVSNPRNCRDFDLQQVDQQRPRWDSGSPRPNDQALVSLLTSHPSKAFLIARVTAFDFEQAASLAWQRGERLADQYGAEHRAYAIRVSGPVLVLRPSDDVVSEQTVVQRRVHAARARLGPEPRLEQSLRYAALARDERAPVVQVLHSWIALETLARGPGVTMGPYQFLMHNLARSLAVHAVRQSLASTWHIASRAGRRGANKDRWIQIERWLGVPNTHRNLPDFNKWVDLMRREVPSGLAAPSPLPRDASLDEAAAVLLELLPDMVPFAREAILRWRWRLAVGNRLSNWCDDIEGQAKATLGRMYVVRNSTVHTAITQAAGGDQLAHAAKNIVDAVYEVLPAWLVPGDLPWRAFDRLAKRANHLHRTWNHLAKPALLNAERLTRPGGDGLAR